MSRGQRLASNIGRAFAPDGHHVEQFSEWSTPADQLMERNETRATVRECIELLPENENFKVITVQPGDDFALEGLAVGLVRSWH